jgi:hypothetical protein
MGIGFANWLSRGPRKLGAPAKRLDTASVATSAEWVGDFSERLAEIEQEKPEDSKIAVAIDHGAMIFTPKQSEWTFARAADVATFLLYIPAGVAIWAALVFEAAAHLLGTWTTRDWAGFNLIGIALVVTSFVLWGILLAARSRLMNLFGRWQLIATPENIVLRRSLMKFSTTTVVDPKFVILGGPQDVDVQSRSQIRTDFRGYRDVVVGLSENDARWLGRALQMLYPGMTEIS